MFQEIWVSKASGEQRKGRAGRTGPGICYRLYSAADYDKFEEYNTAEIHRVSLETVAMQIYNLDLGGLLFGKFKIFENRLLVTPRDFPFIERPDAARLTQAIECLRDQRALEILNMPAVNAATGMKMGQVLPDAVDDEPEIGPAPPVEHIE